MGLIGQKAVSLAIDFSETRTALPFTNFPTNVECTTEKKCTPSTTTSPFTYDKQTTPAFSAEAYLQIDPKDEFISLTDVNTQKTASIFLLQKSDSWTDKNLNGVLGLASSGTNITSYLQYLKQSISTDDSLFISFKIDDIETGNLPSSAKLNINNQSSPLKCTISPNTSKDASANYTALLRTDPDKDPKSVDVNMAEDYTYIISYKGASDFQKKVRKTLCGKEDACEGIKAGKYDVSNAPVLEIEFQCQQKLDVLKKYSFKFGGKDYLYEKDNQLMFRVVENTSDVMKMGMLFFQTKELIIDVSQDTFMLAIGDPDYTVNKTFWLLFAAGVTGLLLIIGITSAIIGHIMYGKTTPDGKSVADGDQSDYQSANTIE